MMVKGNIIAVKVVLRALTVLWVLAALCFFASVAGAHDSWISNGEWRNPAGQWCCGDGDCGVVLEPEKSVSTGPDGYDVDGKVQIDGVQDSGNVTLSVQAHVPYSQKLPSPDGHYWYCRGWDNTPRCFFAPTPTY